MVWKFTCAAISFYENGEACKILVQQVRICFIVYQYSHYLLLNQYGAAFYSMMYCKICTRLLKISFYSLIGLL